SVRSADPLQSAAVNQVVISPSSEWVVLSPEFDPNPAMTSYRATLTSNGQVVWQQESVRLNSKGTIEPVLNAGIFKPGDYLLTLDGRTAQGTFATAARYPFRVIVR